MDKDKLNTYGSRRDWRENKLPGMSDEELERHCESYIYFSAYAHNNPTSDYHFLCDAGYDECKRRGRPEIYKRAYEAARRSAGC